MQLVGHTEFEQSQITFVTRTEYSDNDYIILCSHKYGRMLLESIVIALM